MSEELLSFPRIPARIIGSQFVEAYYKALSNDTENLWRFYEDDSCMSLSLAGEDSSEEFTGQEEIHNKVITLGFENCKISVDTTDVHETCGGCVLVLCTGLIAFASGQEAREFVQTFIIAPVPGASSHYLRNDLMRFLSIVAVEADEVDTKAETDAGVSVVDSQKDQVDSVFAEKIEPVTAPVSPTSVVVDSSNQSVTDAPVIAVTKENRRKSRSKKEDKTPESKSESKQETKQETKPDSSKSRRRRRNDKSSEIPIAAVANAANATSPTSETEPQPKPKERVGRNSSSEKRSSTSNKNTKTQPTTWASLVQNSSAPTQEEPLQQVTPPQNSQRSPRSGPRSAPRQSQKSNVESSQRLPNDSKSHEVDPLSLWVSGFSSQDAKPEEIQKVFAQFGTVKNVSWASAGKNYCYVNFTDAESAKKALAVQFVPFQGSTLKIAEKRIFTNHNSDRRRPHSSRSQQGKSNEQ